MKLRISKQEGEQKEVIGHIALEYPLENLRIMVLKLQDEAPGDVIASIGEKLDELATGNDILPILLMPGDDIEIYSFEAVE